MPLSKQMNLFQDNQRSIEIKKHSALVAINNVSTLQQRKVINVLLRVAKDQLKRSPEKKNFSIDLGVIKKLAGISRHDNTELKQSLKSLVSLAIEYNILGKDKRKIR